MLPCPQVPNLISLQIIKIYSVCFSRNVTEILRLVQAFHHSDRTGQVSHLNCGIVKKFTLAEKTHRLLPLSGLLGTRSSPPTSETRSPTSSRSTGRGRWGRQRMGQVWRRSQWTLGRRSRSSARFAPAHPSTPSNYQTFDPACDSDMTYVNAYLRINI